MRTVRWPIRAHRSRTGGASRVVSAEAGGAAPVGTGGLGDDSGWAGETAGGRRAPGRQGASGARPGRVAEAHGGAPTSPRRVAEAQEGAPTSPRRVLHTRCVGVGSSGFVGLHGLRRPRGVVGVGGGLAGAAGGGADSGGQVGVAGVAEESARGGSDAGKGGVIGGDGLVAGGEGGLGLADFALDGLEGPVEGGALVAEGVGLDRRPERSEARSSRVLRTGGRRRARPAGRRRRRPVRRCGSCTTGTARGQRGYFCCLARSWSTTLRTYFTSPWSGP